MRIEKGEDDITDSPVIRLDGNRQNVIRPAAVVTHAHWSWNKVSARHRAKRTRLE
jgi:hypothetical protein